jgi:AcrR family transcriptional regulator
VGRKAKIKERNINSEKQERILAQASPLFKQKGIRHFSMDALAAELGISKATLYKYFTDREELLLRMLERSFSNILSRTYREFTNDAEFFEVYFNALSIAADELSQISPAFLTDLFELYPHIWQAINQFIENSMQQLAIFYRRGMQLGYFYSNLNPTVMMLTDKLFFTALADPEFISRYGLELNQAFVHYMRLKLQGVVRPEYRHLIPDQLLG